MAGSPTSTPRVRNHLSAAARRLASNARSPKGRDTDRGRAVLTLRRRARRYLVRPMVELDDISHTPQAARRALYQRLGSACPQGLTAGFHAATPQALSKVSGGGPKSPPRGAPGSRRLPRSADARVRAPGLEDSAEIRGQRLNCDSNNGLRYSCDAGRPGSFRS
jgi:hypothetical protein